MKPQNLTAKECNFFLAPWGEDARRAGEGPWFVNLYSYVKIKDSFTREIISSLEKGVVTYETAQGKSSLDIIGGFVSVNQNQVNLCVEL